MPAHASRSRAPAPSAPPSRACSLRHRPANAGTPAELSASPASRPLKLRSVDSGQGIGVGDAVAAGERRGDQGQQLVAGVRPARCVTEVEVGVRQCAEAEPASERGGEQQARVVHEAVVVEGDVYPVGVARW